MSKLGFFSFLFLELCPRVNSNHTIWDLLCLRTNTPSPHVISGFLLGFLGHCFLCACFFFFFLCSLLYLAMSLSGASADCFIPSFFLGSSHTCLAYTATSISLHWCHHWTVLQFLLYSHPFTPFLSSFSFLLFFWATVFTLSSLALFSPCISNSLIVACL